MTDVRSKLRRASEYVTPPQRAFERMVERRERKRRTERIAAATVALVLAIVVVGGTVAVFSGLARDRVQPATDSANPQVDPGEHDLRACIEQAGYDWEEVYPVWNSPFPAPKDSVWDRAFWRAWEVCVVETGAVEPFTEERIAAESRETMAYVRCMRERGWNLPDPEPSDSPYHPGLLKYPQFDVPQDPKAADRYYRDTADCGLPAHGPWWSDEPLPLDKDAVARENREMLEYVTCMRERGWKLPDPKPWEGPYPGLLDLPVFVPETPEAAAQYYRDTADCGIRIYPGA